MSSTEQPESTKKRVAKGSESEYRVVDSDEDRLFLKHDVLLSLRYIGKDTGTIDGLRNEHNASSEDFLHRNKPRVVIINVRCRTIQMLVHDDVCICLRRMKVRREAITLGRF